MKRFLPPLLLSAFLFCSCAAQYPDPAESVAPVAEPAATRPEAPQIHTEFMLSPLSSGAAVRQYAISEPVRGFLPLKNMLLFFSGENTTTLTLLNPTTGQAAAVYESEILLTPENATVQILDNGVSYFDGAAGKTVVLDSMLREIRCIDAPEDMTGMPLLSRDASSLYYCTASAIRVLDLENRISRVLKEAAYPVQSVSGLLLEDTVLQVSITEPDGTWQTLFLSTETGQLKYSGEGNILPQASGSHYLLSTSSSLLCGSADGSPTVLQPRHCDTGCWYLPESNCAVSSGLAENSTVLEYYDLSTGVLRSELTLPGFLFPEYVCETTDGTVWFMITEEAGHRLFGWNPQFSPVSDSSVYIHPYYTKSNPDYDGLAACTLYAQDLSSRYGIEVLIYKDAVATEPWDYRLEYEYQATVLRQELESLEQRLQNFPESFLQTLESKFTSLKICIVKSITGSPESGSLQAVNGIQFLDGFDAYIILATDHDTEYALYHELSHLMETVVLTESVAYDRWDNLNPDGFVYDNDYLTNADRDGSQWLQAGREYFIDTYSMSYPKEDRARLFEYAMTDHHSELFRSPHLQNKLRQMCTGIRDAFGLQSWNDPLLWEQYLTQ